MRNPGKRFEEDFKASVPGDVYFYRLRDGTAWSPGGKTRFTPSNDYDCFLYREPTLWCLELKSVAGKSIRWDALRPNQLVGLQRAAAHCNAGVVVNFRGGGGNNTYYIPIHAWVDLQERSSKQGVNVKEVIGNPYTIHLDAELRRTRYRYSFVHLLRGYT